MTDSMLDEKELAALVAFDTPTICNALEIVAPKRRTVGFTTETMVCPFPHLAPMVGYARTATIAAMEPPVQDRETLRLARLEYYRYIAEGDYAKVVIIQDLDAIKGFGSWWGEVNSAIHKGLGCVGVVTDGSVRDLDDIAPGFNVLSGKVTPSHAWVRPTGIGGEVEVSGMLVHHNDLVHADRHGAVVIPGEVARDVAAAAALSHRREAPIIAAARSDGFSIEMLEGAFRSADEIH